MYEPLGIVALVISIGKRLLQDQCRDDIRWGGLVPSHIHLQWENHRSVHNRNKKLKETSSLFRLVPFLDEKAILRVGNRLQKVALAFKVRHSIVIPQKSRATELLTRQYRSHERRHQGCGKTHNALR